MSGELFTTEKELHETITHREAEIVRLRKEREELNACVETLLAEAKELRVQVVAIQQAVAVAKQSATEMEIENQRFREELELVEVFAFGAHGWEDVESGERASRTVKALRTSFEKTDSINALFDFQEKFKGQVWYEHDRERWQYFVSVGGSKSLPVQPSGKTMLETLVAARAECEGKVPVWRGARK